MLALITNDDGIDSPNVAPEELRGIERARLASSGAVQTVVTEPGAGYVKLAYRGVDAELEPGTDAALLAGGFASFTPLRPVCEADEVGKDLGRKTLVSR